MSQPELLNRVLSALEASSTPYMLTGSYVSSLQGQPRSTHDIDFVVDMTREAMPALLAAFPEPDFYLDELAAGEAIARKSQFNLLDVANGEKVDFWLLTDDAFNRSRFERRYVEQYEGRAIYVSTPEDTILMKLRWTDMSGGSEKQFTDARGVYELQFHVLDLPYMESWADRLGIRDLWDRLKREAEPLR